MVTVHIPDGFLNLPTAAITSGLSLGSLIPAIRKVNQTLSPQRVPLIGMAAAFVFTVQLLSFPVPGGTSIHITGAVLIAILLGPYTGLVIMTSALILQALLFQHGGLLTLGANVLNMGVIGCIIGYYLYRFFFRKYTIGAWIVAWIVIIMGVVLCFGAWVLRYNSPSYRTPSDGDSSLNYRRSRSICDNFYPEYYKSDSS